MTKLIVSIIAASVAWNSAAVAEDTSPATSTAPATITAAPTSFGPTWSAVSDLPAPSTTTSFVNRPLLITSTLVLGATYAASAGVAYTSNRPSDQTNLYYPVVGPWMAYADRDCNSRPCGNDTLAKAALIADGVGQGLGALGMLTSLFIPEKSTRNWYLIGNATTHFGPSSLSGRGYGLGAAGVF